MRVKCVRIINEVTGEEEQRSSWLTIGREYIVLAISMRSRSDILLRFVSDDGPSPVLFDSRQFEVVDNRLSSTWLAWIDENGAFKLAPQRWLRSGFWEDFFNNVPDAIRDYEHERLIIMTEAMQ